MSVALYFAEGDVPAAIEKAQQGLDAIAPSRQDWIEKDMTLAESDWLHPILKQAQQTLADVTHGERVQNNLPSRDFTEQAVLQISGCLSTQSPPTRSNILTCLPLHQNRPNYRGKRALRFPKKL